MQLMASKYADNFFNIDRMKMPAFLTKLVSNQIRNPTTIDFGAVN